MCSLNWHRHRGLKGLFLSCTFQCIVAIFQASAEYSSVVSKQPQSLLCDGRVVFDEEIEGRFNCKYSPIELHRLFPVVRLHDVLLLTASLKVKLVWSEDTFMLLLSFAGKQRQSSQQDSVH